jgi:hypothetical protein
MSPEVIKLEHSDMVFKRAHSKGSCRGPYCTIHNRSDHHMRSFPQIWNPMIFCMQRVCTHGIGHPDPDEINNDVVVKIDHETNCCGCCVPRG